MSLTADFTRIAEADTDAHAKMVEMTNAVLLEHPEMRWDEAFSQVVRTQPEIFARYANGEGVNRDKGDKDA